MRFAHGLRNGFAIAPVEQASYPALATANKKGPVKGPCLLVAGVGFEPTTFRL